MAIYKVIWEIHLDADSYRGAAERCRTMHLDPDSIASFFDVTNTNTGTTKSVDLLDPDDDPQDSPLEQLAQEAE